MSWLKTQFSDIDISVLRFVHHNRITALDDILYFISFATTFVSISILIVILFLLIKNKSNEIRIKFFKLLAVLVFSAIVSFSLKYTIVRERPFVNYPDIQKLSEAGNSSFPSGHTIEAFAIAFAVSILFPKRKYIVAIFLWAFLIAYSRMALGVHYPSDVLAGILLGLTLSYTLIGVYNKCLIKEITK